MHDDNDDDLDDVSDGDSTRDYPASVDTSAMGTEGLLRHLVQQNTEVRHDLRKTLATVTRIRLRMVKGSGRMDLIEAEQKRDQAAIAEVRRRCEERCHTTATTSNPAIPAPLPTSQQEDAELNGKTVNVGAVIKLFGAFAAGVAVVIGALAALGMFK